MQAELADEKKHFTDEPISALDDDEPLIIEGERIVSPKNTPTMTPPSLDDIDASVGNNPPGSQANVYMDDLLSSDDISFDDTEDLPEPELNEISDMLGDPSVSAMAEKDLTDEDEPISLSNDELNGILEDATLPEETFSGESDIPEAFSSPSAEAPSDSQDFFSDDIEDPITLSDEELDGILMDTPEGMALEDANTPLAPSNLEDEHVMPDMDHDELTHEFSDSPLPEPDPELLTDMPQASEFTEAPSSGNDFFESDEDEPIALSDDELDHILADAEADKESSLDMSQHNPDTDPQEIDIPDSSQAQSADFFESDEDEPITLSESELDNILEEAHQEEPADISLPGDEMALGDDAVTSPVPIDDDEGPIALSSEELDGILESGSATDSVPAMDTEEDNEPIALSDDELDGILEDSHEMGDQPESPGEEPPPYFDTDYGDIDAMTEPPSSEAESQPEALPDFSHDEMSGISAPTDDSEDEEIISLPPFPESEHTDLSPDAGDMPSEMPDEALSHPPLLADEDNEPTALSNEELEGILGDSQEMPVDMQMAPNDAELQDRPGETVAFEEDLGSSQLVPVAESTANESPIAEDSHSGDVLPPREDLRKMIGYLDNLLGELPDDVIEKFAQSEYFKLYQKMMEQLDL